MIKKRKKPYYQIPRRKFKRKNTRKKSRFRRWVWRISLVLLLILGIWVAKRYRAWFVSPPEAPYSVPHTIDRITLTPGEDFLTQRVVSWRCDTLLQEAWLDYHCTDPNSDTTWIMLPSEGKKVETRSGKNYYYHAEINSLDPGKTYSYRVKTGKQISPLYEFSIPDSTSATNFIYIGDVQDPEGGKSQHLFKKLYQKHPNPDFIAWGGDQVEGATDAYWNIWYQAINDWTPSVPTIAATGNHEYIKGLSRQLDSRWVPQYNYPKNGPEGFLQRSYYIDFPHMRFIVIDSNDIQWPNSIIRHRQWLKNVLQTTVQPWKIVMFHHGIYSVREGRMNPIIRYAFRSILEEEGADLILQGHDHAYSRITTKPDRFDTITPVYIISSASPKQYRNGFSDIHDRLGSGLYLYQTIYVTDSLMRYRSMTFDDEPYDDLLFLKKDGKTIIKDNARGWKEIFAFDIFPNNRKGQKKRERYRKAIQERKQVN